MSHRHQRGQALVEFALATPLVIVLLFGCFDFGAAMYQSNLVNNAARFGSRYAAVHSVCTTPPSPALGCALTSESDVQTQVTSNAQSMLSKGSPLTVTTTWTGNTGLNGATCVQGTTGIPTQAGCQVKVTVSSPFNLLSFGPLSLNLTISSTSKMYVDN